MRAVNAAEDERAIRSLAAAYTDAVNRRDGEAMAAVYSEDGILHSPAAGAPLQGIGKLRKRFKRLVEVEREFLMQLTHSGVVEIDGDRATARRSGSARPRSDSGSRSCGRSTEAWQIGRASCRERGCQYV